MLKLAEIKSAYFSYLELSSYLFGKGENGIYDINEMPETNQFYTRAKEVAAQLEINWAEMTHEESNRIMLALLEDVYQEMARTLSKKDRKSLVIDITFKLIKAKKR